MGSVTSRHPSRWRHHPVACQPKAVAVGKPGESPLIQLDDRKYRLALEEAEDAPLQASRTGLTGELINNRRAELMLRPLAVSDRIERYLTKTESRDAQLPSSSADGLSPMSVYNRR